jgi:hypothetical protein
VGSDDCTVDDGPVEVVGDTPLVVGAGGRGERGEDEQGSRAGTHDRSLTGEAADTTIDDRPT